MYISISRLLPVRRLRRTVIRLRINPRADGFARVYRVGKYYMLINSVLLHFKHSLEMSNVFFIYGFKHVIAI